MELEDRIRAFFADYEAAFNRSLAGPADVDATVDAFTECFLSAHPGGIWCGTNNEEFRAALIGGYEFYRRIGTRSMRVARLDVTPLDAWHAMVKIGWDSRYQQDQGAEVQIEFDVIYFVRFREEPMKIFAYITGDEQRLLREHGLLPR